MNESRTSADTRCPPLLVRMARQLSATAAAWIKPAGKSTTMLEATLSLAASCGEDGMRSIEPFPPLLMADNASVRASVSVNQEAGPDFDRPGCVLIGAAIVDMANTSKCPVVLAYRAEPRHLIAVFDVQGGDAARQLLQDSKFPDDGFPIVKHWIPDMAWTQGTLVDKLIKEMDANDFTGAVRFGVAPFLRVRPPETIQESFRLVAARSKLAAAYPKLEVGDGLGGVECVLDDLCKVGAGAVTFQTFFRVSNNLEDEELQAYLGARLPNKKPRDDNAVEGFMSNVNVDDHYVMENRFIDAFYAQKAKDQLKIVNQQKQLLGSFAATVVACTAGVLANGAGINGAELRKVCSDEVEKHVRATCGLLEYEFKKANDAKEKESRERQEGKQKQKKRLQQMKEKGEEGKEMETKKVSKRPRPV